MKRIAIKRWYTASLLVCFLAFNYAQTRALSQEDQALKGEVEEQGTALGTKKSSVGKKPLLKSLSPWVDMNQPDNSANAHQGETSEDALNGQADQSGSGWQDESPKSDQQGNDHRLQGYASQQGLQGKMQGEDPDAEDREMMIEWDKWRNRFLRAVQLGMQENINNPSESNLRWDPSKQTMVSQFPLGIEAWFSCQITPDRRIIHAKILHSSGYKAYDEAILQSLDNLQGSGILRYPQGSKRLIVAQVAGIKTADTSQYQYFHFGDVEHQMVPGGQ